MEIVNVDLLNIDDKYVLNVKDNVVGFLDLIDHTNTEVFWFTSSNYKSCDQMDGTM
jgi:hypothetical protein